MSGWLGGNSERNIKYIRVFVECKCKATLLQEAMVRECVCVKSHCLSRVSLDEHAQFSSLCQS